MSGRLFNKVALVTGAASGIGCACARHFAEEGAAAAKAIAALGSDAGYGAGHSHGIVEMMGLA